MQPQGYPNYSGGSYGYNVAQSFESFCSTNSLDSIAMQNQTYISPSTPGMPSDSFRRVSDFTSSRYTQPLSEGKKFLKGLGDMFSSIGMVSKLVSYFYPPAAAVSMVSEIASPVLSTFAGDMTPKPVVFQTEQKYNPWLR